MPGLYNNETSMYEDAPWLTYGLWLEQDSDSKMFDENSQHLWIIPNDEEGNAEIEGPDHVKFVQGFHEGRCVIDVLNSICRKMKSHDPRDWFTPENWANFGLVPISDTLKRFSEQDGLYHA